MFSIVGRSKVSSRLTKELLAWAGWWWIEGEPAPDSSREFHPSVVTRADEYPVASTMVADRKSKHRVREGTIAGKRFG